MKEQPNREMLYGILLVVVLVVMFAYMFVGFTNQIPSADEMVFLRVTQNLPNYESHMEWYTLDGKTDPNTFLPPTPLYEANYEVPVWLNPPLCSYLTWPLVKLFFRENTIEQIRQSVMVFRTLALFMIWFCILTMLYLVRKRNASNKVMFYSIVPLLATIPFYIKWTGCNWWYYDSFVFLFLSIALLMRETKYKKYIFIPLVLMAGSKLVGFLFLIPFVLENKKLALCALAIVPYLIQCWVVTGDPLYIVHIWYTHENLSPKPWSMLDKPFLSFFANRLWYMTVGVKKCFILLLVTITPFVDLIRHNPMRDLRSWFFPALFVVACIYGLALEAFYYHMIAILLIGILISGLTMTQRQARLNPEISTE